MREHVGFQLMKFTHFSYTIYKLKNTNSSGFYFNNDLHCRLSQRHQTVININNQNNSASFRLLDDLQKPCYKYNILRYFTTCVICIFDDLILSKIETYVSIIVQLIVYYEAFLDPYSSGSQTLSLTQFSFIISKLFRLTSY